MSCSTATSRPSHPLRILIVGSGGREHAYAWKLSQSPSVQAVFVAPGNGGSAPPLGEGEGTLAKITNANVKGNDYPGLVKFGVENGVNLVVPGPEAPLVDGIEGHFRAVGIKTFGPSQGGAQLEASKAFSKDFMNRHNIPTATYQIFRDYEKARAYIDEVSHDVVIKASGLAGGKGVIIPSSKAEAHEALRQVMLDHSFGEAGDEVVVEEFLGGDELSIITFSDGYTIRSLPPAQDHKRALDGDTGPNTGGMGCYAPTRIADEETREAIDRTVVQPTIDGMRKDGIPLVGILFTGLMMTPSGPKVLEFNVRGGDPEIETLLPLLSPDTDLALVMLACAEHWLDGVSLKVQPKFSTTVIAVAPGYPEKYPKGSEITIKPNETAADDSIFIFHAGTALVDNRLVTAGGRVLAVTATADTLEDAVKAAYKGLERVSFDGMHYRKDIAHRAFRDAAPSQPAGLTYASAGVSIDSGNALVKNIKSAVASTKRPGTDATIGGFGGSFSLAAAGSGYHPSSPTLIGAIDGVGTKLLVANALGKHDTVGIDLVAMNVNDLIVQGAEPLFFLDCFSSGKLDVAVASAFVGGVAEGCKRAGCALIGGETAEMPGVFDAASGHYDAVGAAVGAANLEGGKASLLPDKANMRAGDVLLGLASDGVHSNGFSLVRKIVEASGSNYSSAVPFQRTSSSSAQATTTTITSLGEALLTPTRIYVKPLLSALRTFQPSKETTTIKGLAHITGGGLVENVPRMLPANLAARIDATSWGGLPPVFHWLKDQGNVSASEMARTFNVGIGMAVVVEKRAAEEVKAFLEEGESVFVIGELIEREQGKEACVLEQIEQWDQ